MSIDSDKVQVYTTQTTTECTALPLPEPTECVVEAKQKSFIQTLPERIPAFGLLCAISSETMFSLASLIVKVLTELHSIEVLVFRCVFQFAPFFFICVKEKYPIFGVPGHRIDLCLRCISGTIALICLYMSYRLMPLSDASTIFNTSPIFVTIFAYFLLKEPITLIHGLTGIITIVGVFIISKPEFIFGKDEIDDIYDQKILGIILASVAAIAAGYTLINLRKLKTTPVPVIVMWHSITCVVSGSVVLPFLDKWVIPYGVYTWLMLVAIGVAGILHQYLLTTALKYESPGPISVARNSNIVLAFVWEVTIFAEPVEWTSIVGACLVTSCVVIIALSKCYKDNPKSFQEFFKKYSSYFCHKTNLESKLNLSETSIESYDKNSTKN